ncbi:four-carbon acid sugar kinase family protein [Azospirillum sp. RWY-5-1]|uniref:Four-carbon acid sugar kinase family protein n=1 Tax=Azospirillum oleiclasticum TaxID=2735135 RepID=A0ABX2TJ08_9PROT|nr:four-carbon acid sugar kinase family protein [Azospirillum oleiclasticum]NYZ17073.1 four-carbon acid sugar kinase family protein [Azospirillum oleiclasticum]NYZ24211.1 four-carbon acid sugar kinase family protein [Azospirillum oleiclasticum]
MSTPDTLPPGLLVAFYGDDYTGSASVMEVMTFAGLPTVLFLDVPTPEQLARFVGYSGIGIAGVARSQSPAWMDENLPPVYRALADLGASVTHYKICSTLDSAPHVGSIGRAADLAIPVLGGDWTPLVVAAPGIARFQAFGNLFAVAADGRRHRLDRHPTMARHPVTPMDEADVCKHLARQTDRRFGLVDLVSMKAGQGGDALATVRAEGAEIVALDVVDEETLAEAGRLIWENRGQRLFALGSQGVEYALVAHWRRTGALAEPPAGSFVAEPAARIAAVSGSCSPVTAGQIRHAAENGFAAIRVDAALAVDAAAWDRELGRAADAALAALGEGRDPLVYSAAGPDDPAVAAMREAVRTSGQPAETVNDRIGAGLGRLLDRVMRDGGVTRAAIAGGDTSGHAAMTLGIHALTALAPVAPGSPLCRAHSDDPAHADLEIALKGGQMGAPDFFTAVRRGGRPA